MNSQADTANDPTSTASTDTYSELVENCESECAEQREDFQQLMEEVGDSLAYYCRRRPGVAAFSVFAVGFFLGWKIKPW